MPRPTVFRRTWDDYRSNRINLLIEQQVTSIDPEASHATTEKGLTLGYDRLVLAHGGSLFIPPIEGVDTPGVHSCNQLAEADRPDPSSGSAAVVIGSGAIGIEAGEALKKRGYKEGLVVGGQAIGKFADFIGLFMGAMCRKEAIPGIRQSWPLITRSGSIYPWTTRKLGELIGLTS